jgi:phosphoribosylanthranilate isomerase
MWIKICANTNLADAALAEELGADAVGFVFAESKRRVTAEQIAEISEKLPEPIEKVGVFSTTSRDEIEHMVVAAGLSMAQLHSTYSPALVAQLYQAFGGEIKLIQTVPYEVGALASEASDRRFAETLQAALSNAGVWAVLIDAARAGVSGGLGVAFDWKHVAGLVAPVVAARDTAARILLAGGLSANNVAEAIHRLQPFGVDVASGVEASPGRKNPARLRAFLHAARTA